MAFKEFLLKNREVAQLVYGVFLIVLIPFLIAINTVFIINAYNGAIDVSLQRQALSFGRSIYSLIKNDLGSGGELNEKIKEAAKRNSDVLELNILKPRGESFVVEASTNDEKIGKEEKFYYYNLAWVQPENDGLAADSVTLAVGEKDEKILNKNERFWLVAMPVIGISGGKEALLTVKLSSKIIDDLTSDNRNRSIALLVVTVLVSFLFLMINIRLWDYALLYKKIKEVDQMKDEFVSMASHELRTPVGGIKGGSAMILDGSFGEISPEIKNVAGKINNAACRLATLVEDLLDVGRIEQGRLNLKNKDMDPGPVIQKVLEDMKTHADTKKLKLEYLPHKEKLPRINIDEDRFTQILINLIGNAIKYTENGGVKILTEENKKRSLLEIKIKDTGIGMSVAEKEKLFQKFYRIQNEKTKEIAGTGLGLWITRELVNMMGGKISVDSIENTGTQVSIAFLVAK